MELDGVDRSYLRADLPEQRSLDTLVQSNHKHLSLWGLPCPVLVVLQGREGSPWIWHGALHLITHEQRSEDARQSAVSMTEWTWSIWQCDLLQVMLELRTWGHASYSRACYVAQLTGSIGAERIG